MDERVEREGGEEGSGVRNRACGELVSSPVPPARGDSREGESTSSRGKGKGGRRGGRSHSHSLLGLLDLLEALLIRVLSNHATHALLQVRVDRLVVRVVVSLGVRVGRLVKVLLADVVADKVNSAAGTESGAARRYTQGRGGALGSGDGELDDLDILDEGDVDRDLLGLGKARQS